MKYEVVQPQYDAGDWRVEAIDDDREGECYVTIFAGPQSEDRAREYAEWKSATGQAQIRPLRQRRSQAVSS